MRKVLFFILNLGALLCTVSSSPSSPINVIFSSVNLRNVLQWSPGRDTPDDTHFTVQYAIYGDSVEGGRGRRVHWRPVRHCTEIVRTWCDLSNETWDLEQGYHARVRAVSRRASSKWALTRRRFDPKTDTSFGPPLVSLELEDNNVIITLEGPMRYQPNNHTQAVSMATLYNQMTYNLSIYNARHGQTHHFPMVSSLYKYRLMEYNTKYCFSAKTRLLSMPAQCQSSAWQCTTTPQDPVIGQLRKVVVCIVVPSVCMCVVVVVGYLLYCYLTGKGQKSPYILHPPAFHPPVLTLPPENPKLIIITIIKGPQPECGKSNPACPKQPHHITHSPLGYTSQTPEALPQPEEPWDDLPVDYGFIGMDPKVAIRGEDGDTLKGKHQKCAARDRYESKEWRVEDDHSAGHTQTEISTLIQAEVWSEHAIPTQTLFINTPQTGLLRPLLNPQARMEGGVGEEMNGDIRVRTDGGMDRGVEERSENEEVPLLSAYASQCALPSSHPDQSDFLPDDYGTMSVELEEDDNDEEEEDGNICIDWDPQTRKLVLPQMLLEFSREGGLDGLTQRENGMMGGEEMNLTNNELRLENVFVRQGSEEEAEAQREMERGGRPGWEVDDLLTRWDLVISMDQ